LNPLIIPEDEVFSVLVADL